MATNTLIIMAVVAAFAAGTMGSVSVAENENYAFKHTSDGMKESADKESYAAGSRGALTVTESSTAILTHRKFIRKVLMASAVKSRKLVEEAAACHTIHCAAAPEADWCHRYDGCSYCYPGTFKCAYAWEIIP